MPLNKIVEGVYWVGVHFAEMKASVNAFLLKDEKTTLIDTGPTATQEMIMQNIKALVDPSKIDYIVLTHAEIDHCGGLGRILKEAPKAKVVASQIAGLMLPMYGIQTQPQIVKDGDILELGERRLRFVSTPIVDTWDTLLVFEEPDKILFSADAFGGYAAEWTLFAKGDITQDIKFYNKMKFPWMELASQEKMQQALNKIKGLDPKIIAPGHGLLINSNIEKYLLASSQL